MTLLPTAEICPAPSFRKSSVVRKYFPSTWATPKTSAGSAAEGEAPPTSAENMTQIAAPAVNMLLETRLLKSAKENCFRFICGTLQTIDIKVNMKALEKLKKNQEIGAR